MRVGDLVKLWWYGEEGIGIIAKWNVDGSVTVLWNGQLYEWNKKHLKEIV